MSKFDEWFKTQLGRRASVGFSLVDDSDLEDKIEAGKRAQAELDRRRQWDAQRQSALYAWWVKEEEK